MMIGSFLPVMTNASPILKSTIPTLQVEVAAKVSNKNSL